MRRLRPEEQDGPEQCDDGHDGVVAAKLRQPPEPPRDEARPQHDRHGTGMAKVAKIYGLLLI